MADTAPNSILRIVIISGLVISALKLSESDIQGMFKNSDNDHDNIVRLNDLTQIFDKTDKDGDHYLTKYEFLAAHPNEEGTAFFNFYDKLDGTADHRVARVVAEKILQHLDEDIDIYLRVARRRAIRSVSRASEKLGSVQVNVRGAYLVLVTLESERQITCTRHALTFNDQLTVTCIQLRFCFSNFHNTDFSEHLLADTLAEENLFVTLQSLDKDQDGILKLSDIFQYCDNYDLNGDGFLSYQEFIDGLYPEIPKVAFHFYDKLDGIKDVKIGRGVAHAILAYLDKDLDSEVSYTEFTQTFPLFKDAVTRALEVLTD